MANGERPVLNNAPWEQASMFVLRAIEALYQQDHELERRQRRIEAKVNIGIGIILVLQLVLTTFGAYIAAKL